jgi:NADPH2:quinone reductase
VRAIQINAFGGPDVMRLVDLPEPEVADGETLLTVRMAGVNYADTHATEDSYLARQTLPLIPGGEVVVEYPDGRRALALTGSGGYAERIAVDPRLTIPIPSTIDDPQALCCLIQGATAWHLLRTSTHLVPGETVVVHAAAGGVGTVAVQLAKLWGAGRVIATASSPAKRELALDLGADVAIDATTADLRSELRAANEGKGVNIILEMTGGRVFDESLAALAPFGRIAVYGTASRELPKPVQPGRLMAHSTAVVGFWLAHVARRPAMLREAVLDLFGLIEHGQIRTVVGGVYGLGEVADAHRALLSRGTVGKLVLDPNR